MTFAGSLMALRIHDQDAAGTMRVSPPVLDVPLSLEYPIGGIWRARSAARPRRSPNRRESRLRSTHGLTHASGISTNRGATGGSLVGRERKAMGIAIAEEHRELAAVVRSFVESHGVREAARAALDLSEEELPGFWSEMASLGWLGLHLPERYGGSGFGLTEIAVVVEELGRVPAPGPLLPSVISSAVIAGDRRPHAGGRAAPRVGRRALESPDSGWVAHSS